jgi:hypothetical protein
MKIAVVGYGNVGRTLGLRWSQRGHEVVFAVRDPAKPEVRGFMESNPGVTVGPLEEAVRSAEAVCLAVPYAAALSLAPLADVLADKIVIDCTNPIGPGLVLSVGLTTSGAEEIARALPGARVVKAFSTTGWENMADATYPGYGGLRPLMPVCGDDKTATTAVCRLAEDLGFEAWDWGPLSGARYLEPLAMLWIVPARAGGEGPDFAFARLRR